MKTVLVGCVTAILLCATTISTATAQQVKIRTDKDFPDGLKQFAGPLGAFDALKAALKHFPEGDVDAKFNKPGPQNIHRYEWLRAARRNL